MFSYYNEIDPYAAQWLRNLIEAGHIAPGIVDERSIEDIKPSDLAGYTQVHFFAGIGVWSLALRRAGWSDDRPIWTGSCPCQPFSSAGAGAGFSDERHLWPAMFHLIEQCKPAVVLGEQVASKDANPWIDLVQTDLEAVGYAVGAVAFPSASVGAPHIRDRLYWVGHASSARLEGHTGNGGATGWKGSRGSVAEAGVSGGMADLHRDGRHQTGQCFTKAGGDGVVRDCATSGLGDANGQRARRDSGSLCGALDRENGQHCAHHADTSGADGGLADTKREQREECLSRLGESDRAQGGGAPIKSSGLCLSGRLANSTECSRQPGEPWAGVGGLSPCDGGDQRGSAARPTNGFWRDADWLLCRDGKWRPVEPGTFPLVNGAAARVGRLRAYGNAINAKAAQVFIESVMECI